MTVRNGEQEIIFQNLKSQKRIFSFAIIPSSLAQIYVPVMKSLFLPTTSMPLTLLRQQLEVSLLSSL